MNESYSPFENEGAGAAADAGSTPAREPIDPTSGFESSKTQTSPATDDLKTAARATADEYRGKAERAWGDAQERARSFHKEVEQEVRQNPTKAVFTVLGIGFLLGLIFRR